MKITSYYIDEHYILYTYIGNEKYTSIRDVFTDEEAEQIVTRLNNQLN